MWVYNLTLNEVVDAGTIESDWTANHPAPPSGYGVAQGGLFAVVLTTNRASNYAEFESTAYVDSVTEHTELPDPGGSNWSPPYEADPEGRVILRE